MLGSLKEPLASGMMYAILESKMNQAQQTYLLKTSQMRDHIPIEKFELVNFSTEMINLLLCLMFSLV